MRADAKVFVQGVSVSACDCSDIGVSRACGSPSAPPHGVKKVGICVEGMMDGGGILYLQVSSSSGEDKKTLNMIIAATVLSVLFPPLGCVAFCLSLGKASIMLCVNTV